MIPTTGLEPATILAWNRVALSPALRRGRANCGVTNAPHDET
jgi:hypothetical protein